MESTAGSQRARWDKVSSTGTWLRWFVTSAFAVPATIILHELGHYAVAYLSGFPDVVLHFGSVSHNAAEADFPGWQHGLQAAAGPLVTLAIAFLCCYAVLRIGVRPWTVAPAFAAAVRSLIIGPAYLLTRIRHPAAEGNFDELNAARHLGLSAGLVVAVNVLLLAGALGFLISRMSSGAYVSTLSAIVFGIAAGLALYIDWLGPWVLP